MKLEMITINNFRSISKVQLENCGGFNVLIGKNNSGKSNILSGIHAFFMCIQDGNIVSLDPPLGKAIDNFQKNIDLPIDITLTFSLLLAERDALIRDIVTEAPQMKNAVDGLDPSLQLSTTVTILSSPKNFAFVSKINLGGTLKPGTSLRDPEHTILKVGIESAAELQDQLSSNQERNIDMVALQTLLDSRSAQRYWREMRTENSKSAPFSFFIREMLSKKPSPRVLAKLERMLDDSNSYEEFINVIQTLLTEIQQLAKAQKEPLRHKIEAFAGDETAIPRYVLSILHKISGLKVLYLTERRKQIGREEAERLLALKVKRGGPEVLRTIQETVSALLGVNIDAFSGDSLSRTGESIAELDVDNFLVQVNGSGIREALRLVLDYEFEHPSILLVEEPETHLHPALETSMMRYLKRMSSDCQIFLTTHSTNFLDTADMKNVYLISKSDSTHIRLLDVEEAEAQIPRELGIRLSSLFMFDRLVFVEGPSDEDILREWASILGVNFSQANVGFIHMGGVKNFTHFAAEKTLAFLTKRQVKLWFLMDRDEREAKEITKITERLGDKAVVKFLTKREIENYLIRSRPIVDLMNLKKQADGSKNNENLPTEAEVKQKINECAEGLKQVAIDKRVGKLICEPIYPSRERLFGNSNGLTIIERASNEINQLISKLEEVKNRTNEILREQSETVDATWQKDKLSLVPGDELLDMVFKAYQFRFIKERDGARLAALMQEGEIEQEVKDIIREIGRA